jgi:glutaredoxin
MLRTAGDRVAGGEQEDGVSEETAAAAGVPRSGGAPRVTVYTRVGCPACEKAEADVARICGELGETWQALDVDADPDLRAEYGDRVPVIDIDGREHGFWKVEEQRFRAALTRPGC